MAWTVSGGPCGRSSLTIRPRKRPNRPTVLVLRVPKGTPIKAAIRVANEFAPLVDVIVRHPSHRRVRKAAGSRFNVLDWA
jgi:hypothetical protein